MVWILNVSHVGSCVKGLVPRWWGCFGRCWKLQEVGLRGNGPAFGGILSLVPSWVSLCLLSIMRWAMWLHHISPPRCSAALHMGPEAMKPKWPQTRLKSLKPWAKINLSSLNWFSQVFVTTMASRTNTGEKEGTETRRWKTEDGGGSPISVTPTTVLLPGASIHRPGETTVGLTGCQWEHWLSLKSHNHHRDLGQAVNLGKYRLGAMPQCQGLGTCWK
jgi:hypothetical protein